MNDQPVLAQGKRGLASALLPVVRRTLQIGRGPPFVLSLARSLGVDFSPRAVWTRSDERLARTLARRAGRLLSRRVYCTVNPKLGIGETIRCAAVAETFRQVRGHP